MRLPLYNPLESRDGTLAKDAALKNAVVEVEGDVLIMAKRPGIVRIASGVLGGMAQGLVGLVGITYAIVSDIMYLFSSTLAPDGSEGYGKFLGGYSLASGAWTGFSMGGEYEIGDEILVQDPDTGEIDTYYSYTTSTGIPPSTAGTGSEIWKKTPPGSSRYYARYAYAGDTALAASKGAAAAIGFLSFNSLAEHTCPGSPPYYLWWSGDYSLIGSTVFGSQFGTAGTRECGDPLNGPYTVAIADIYQTA